MANPAYLHSILVGVMLLAGFHRVRSGLTLQASASQSHPMEGHSTELTCNVRSMNQSQVIIWSKDQSFITWGDTMGQMMSSRFQLVMNSMNDSLGTLTSYMLIINDITRDDDGRYQCQVLQEKGNGFSAMASETVVVSVLYFPASVFPFCSLNGSQTFLTGTELTVSCTSEVGNPQISSLWVGEDDAVEQPVYHTVESSSMMISELELTATRDLEGATYICRVTSPAYPDTDRTCSLGPLRIIDWPIVTVTRSVPKVTEGGDVHFLCDTEPRMPMLNWLTVPAIDPDRLAVTDDGAVLTVRNVQKGDNLTSVICQVPYKNTQLEAHSVVLMHESKVTPSSGATTQLCIPWFGAFLFVVTVNLVLCIIIVHLLVKVKKLTSKGRAVESDEDSLNGVDSTMMEPKKNDIVLTWPASRRSVSSANWSMRSEKSLRDQRRKSWQHIPPDEDEMNGRETLTYTELSPDSMERGKSRKKQLRKSVSLSEINDPPDSDSYITPSTHANPMTKAATSSSVKISRKIGQASVLPPSIKARTSKTARPSKKGGIKSISERIPVEPSRSSYMDLSEKTGDFLPQKQTYQALQKTPYSSRCTSQPMASSIKKSRKKSSQDMDDTMGDSGIYGDSGAYMKYGRGDMTSTDSDGSKSAQRRNSMMGESASYMPVGTAQCARAKTAINQHRSGTLMSSQSSVDTRDNQYEIPPDALSTDDSTGEATYAKTLDGKSKGIQPRRAQSRATVSSRAPLPDPAAVEQKNVLGDTASTDGSYKEPYHDKLGGNRVYFVLNPDRGSYTNYGADVSSESDSYQGAEPLDLDPANKAAKSAPPARKSSSSSDKSYLELGDVEGEIKGYMDMTKVQPEQFKRPADVTKVAPNLIKAPSKITKGPAKSTKVPAKSTKVPAKSTKVPAKVTKQVSQSDSECSSNEYYEQMDGSQQSHEYAVPPSTQLKLVVKETDPTGAGSSESSSEKHPTPPSVKPKPKKKDGWGLFRN